MMNSILWFRFYKRERYLQLNIRSMVEHIARIALNKSYAGGDFDGTVRRVDFEYLKGIIQLKTGLIYIMYT